MTQLTVGTPVFTCDFRFSRAPTTTVQFVLDPNIATTDLMTRKGAVGVRRDQPPLAHNKWVLKERPVILTKLNHKPRRRIGQRSAFDTDAD
jgi:hypothetical protein